MDYVKRFQLQKQFYLNSTSHERIFKKWNHVRNQTKSSAFITYENEMDK